MVQVDWQAQADRTTKFFQKYPRLLGLLVSTVNVGARVLALFARPKFRLSKPIPLSKEQEFEAHKTLAPKYALYRTKISDRQDQYGFIESDHCDSLLFTSLAAVAGMNGVQILAARDKDGRWHRRPTHRPCYPNGSRSTISRDMLLGLLWYIWSKKDLQLAKDLWQAGKRDNWIMGEGDIARIYFTPGLQATLAEIIYRLGGPNYWLSRRMPQSWSKMTKDYGSHLQALHLALRASLLGGMDSKMLDVSKHLNKKQPHNPLFKYLVARYDTGDFSSVIKSLGNKNWWPEDRLPTEKDRRGSWLQERDYGHNWEPGEGDRTHTGGDFMFIYHLLMRQ